MCFIRPLFLDASARHSEYLSKSPVSPFAAALRHARRTAIRCEWPRNESHQIVNHSMRARIPRPPLAVESNHCLTLNIMRPLSRSAAASSVLGVFRMLCISNFGVRNWPLVLVPGVNPFGRPELRCSGQCGDLNPLNPTRSTQCPAQNPKSSCISSFLASLLISALRLLAHLGPAPPRSSRPCASLLISALRLLAHLGPAPPRPISSTRAWCTAT